MSLINCVISSVDCCPQCTQIYKTTNVMSDAVKLYTITTPLPKAPVFAV